MTEKCIPNVEENLRGNCSVELFQCKSGECIPMDSSCDGRVDCSDASDEKIESCASKCCPPFGFRCGYGGCVDEKAKCDRKFDCADESDENYLLCGYPKGGPPPITTTTSTTPPPNFNTDIVYYPDSFDRLPPGKFFSQIILTTRNKLKFSLIGACRINRLPRNGWIEYAAPPSERISNGDFVNPLTVVNYKCLENHLVDGPTANFCFNGQWRNAVPDCKPFCSTRAISGVSIRATSCFLNDLEKSCYEPASPGTIARINCQPGYERQVQAKQQVITCGDDGTWQPQPDLCSPICGQEAPDGTPYVLSGFKANITQVPWHIGLYKKNSPNGKFEFQCGGTIVNARVVISAMHCMWDRSQNKPYDASLFKVAAGKQKIDIDAEEELKTTVVDVERVFYDEGYNDVTGNFAADVVLIILRKPLEFQAHIAPICIPYGLQYEEKRVTPGLEGRVAGWGLTSSGGQASENLKIVELPAIDRQKCLSDSDPGFRPQITPDKFCAGYLNSNVGVCQGDSGGGLVFPTQERNRTVYYLRGIVSTGANKQDSCDGDKYSTFTNILYYEDLLQKTDARYRPR